MPVSCRLQNGTICMVVNVRGIQMVAILMNTPYIYGQSQAPGHHERMAIRIYLFRTPSNLSLPSGLFLVLTIGVQEIPSLPPTHLPVISYRTTTPLSRFLRPPGFTEILYV